MNGELYKISAELLMHIKGSDFKFLNSSAKETTVDVVHVINGEGDCKILIPGADILRMTTKTFDMIPDANQMSEIQERIDEGLTEFTVGEVNVSSETDGLFLVSAIEKQVDEIENEL